MFTQRLKKLFTSLRPQLVPAVSALDRPRPEMLDSLIDNHCLKIMKVVYSVLEYITHTLWRDRMELGGDLFKRCASTKLW